MKLSFFTILLFSFLSYAYAQEPTMLSISGYGGNGDDLIATHVTRTNDGGFILQLRSSSNTGTGSIDSFCLLDGNRTIFLKFNADASSVEWSKCYGFAGDSVFNYLFPTSDGGSILAGIVNSTSGNGFIICKEDITGNIIWSKSYSRGNNVGLTDMLKTDDNGFLFLGESIYVDTNFSIHYGSWMLPDICLLKVDSNGDKVWSKVVGGTYIDKAHNIVSGPGGGFYVYGSTNSGDYDCNGYHGTPNSSADAYLARFDKDGNILWHRDIGGTGYEGEYGYGTSNGKVGVIITTRTNSTDGDVHHYIGNNNFWVVEIDSNNTIVWDNSYGGLIGGQTPNAICKATDGTIWIAGGSGQKSGQVDTSFGNGDAWIVHADSVGGFLSAKVFGGSRSDAATMIFPLTNEKVITGGYYALNDGLLAPLTSYGLFGTYDIFLATFISWPVEIGQVNVLMGKLEIYPNPANDVVTFTYNITDACSNMRIIISSIVGKAVAEIAVTNTIGSVNWNTGSLTPGIYMFRATCENGVIKTGKLIIQK